MASEDTVPLDNTSELSDLPPPPPYEYWAYPVLPPAQQETTAAPPYPGLDVELPKYCEVVVTTQPPRRCQLSEQRRVRPKAVEYIPYVVLIGLAVISFLLCFPVGACAVGYSISALQHKRLYKERSNHVRTAIGCIMLACATGIPIHVVIWKNGF